MIEDVPRQPPEGGASHNEVRSMPMPTSPARNAEALVAAESELVARTKRFPLTWEQHQLLKSAEYRPLIAHLAAKRRRATIVLSLLAIGLVTYAVYAALLSLSYTALLVIGLGCGFWAVLRYRNSRSLFASLRRYEAFVENDSAGTSEPSLARELRLNYQLSYDQHQLLKAGDARGAAKALIAERRANSRNFVVGTLAISAFAVIFSKLTGELIIVVIPVLALFAWLCILREHATIRGIQRRLEIFGSESPPSPGLPTAVAPDPFSDPRSLENPYSPPGAS